MKNISSKFWVAGVLYLVTSSANAQWTVHDPISMAKAAADSALSLGKQATIISNQVLEYQNMVYNTLTLQNPALKPFGDVARAAANTYYQGQSLMYRAQNLDQAFASTYPSYMNYQSYAMNVGRGGQTLEAKYKEWSDKSYDNVRSALQAANIEAGNMSSDRDMVEKLVQQANGTGGQMQALQGLQQLMGNQSRQMSGLNDLMLTQIRMQANYYGMEIERRSAFDASEQSFRSTRPMNSAPMGF